MPDKIKKVKKEIARKPRYKILTEDSIVENGITLYRIEALKDFGDVKVGDKGGYIEKEDNLSQSKSSWVYDTSKVYGNARIRGAAKITDNSTVCGDALVASCGCVKSGAKVEGKRVISRQDIVSE